ncbi:MAG TPA: protein translocase subunit SecF [Actinomycetota bacterium]|nr:protein translocase subunit SecF [Actinomycetota bacterium]
MSGTWSRLYQGETDFDFLGRRRLWFSISAVLLAISALSLVFNGLDYGIEFRGGVQIQAPVPASGPLADASEAEIAAALRDALGPLGATDAQVQVTEEENRSVIVQTEEVSDPRAQDRVVEAVAETTGADPELIDSQRIGSRWGAEITAKAVRALVVFLVVVTAFISWRFEPKMAVGALVALVHDLLITAGIYSLVGFEVTPSTIIAILTILGYSLYDTVVVYDKVEENTALYATPGRMTYQASANLAMNQVFMRSLNTSLATLLPVAALLFVGAGLLGASTLKDLALALFVGILTGAYSSIFVATPILSMLKEREPRYRSVREKMLKEAARTRLVPVPVGVSAGATSAMDKAEAPAPAAPQPRPKQAAAAARPRAGSKKAKRRKRR